MRTDAVSSVFFWGGLTRIAGPEEAAVKQGETTPRISLFDFFNIVLVNRHQLLFCKGALWLLAMFIAVA